LRDAFWPVAHHVIGKDILRFHCVFWPALLLAAGYELPQQIFVHGYLVIDEKKISKSRGNVIEPLELVDVYGVDALRFYVARVTRFGQDGNASVDDFHEHYERELGNDLGNLVSRTTAMIARYRDGRVAPGRPNEELGGLLEHLRAKLVERFDAWDLTGGLEDIWEIVRWLNKHVESTAPWQLAKDEAQAGELDAVLYDLADGLRAVTVALSPYLPDTAPQILAALQQPVELGLDRIAYGLTPETAGITAAAPLFPRVDQPLAAA
jgi:methionyl-tRNA synthetase